MAVAGNPHRNANILERFNDNELLKRYRLNRGGIMTVVELVRDAVTSPTNRNNPITAEIKVLTTLRYLATGKMQLCSADELHISQPSVSRILHQTINALCRPHIIRQFIRFPLDVRQLHRNNAHFMDIAGLPGVVGVIDGTHVRIIAPSEDEHAYVNRKKIHSINTQIVFDASYTILDIVAKWPGATHDSRILQESGLRLLFERHHVPAGCHLLGDSGYPCRTWLLTPYIHPHPGPQLNYNRAHKKTRSVVERGIGQMKRRFHVLHGEIRLTPEKASRIITVCAILHNLRMKMMMMMMTTTTTLMLLTKAEWLFTYKVDWHTGTSLSTYTLVMALREREICFDMKIDMFIIILLVIVII
ncbi:hypothetical protein ABG768_021722 [Culter alburnus]|uniref:Putative nuclease HARBI1 n=1 Tax=Culter alburnus TaxID=194366 RepID=A0AAW2ASW5_CULAL